MQQIRFPQNEFQSFEAPLRAEIDIRAPEVLLNEDGMAASAEPAIHPGADHAFAETPHPSAAAANARIDRFLVQCPESR